ncbi:toll/interleukin-1 receptor domain-containing protein [Candidatus Frankia nodulisporulans]|uniref:toll/interleukin-1 receptor domain-containing protein n=1 Tax=Candidatus Frankia nodulisporulans TaxID=2060052 RepID=UPI001CDCC51C|nr:toll/interleukin-1 receptor domain-containing protein [Candidatus Frankia nodulisporulans]
MPPAPPFARRGWAAGPFPVDSSAGGLRRPVMVETVRVTVGGAVDDGYEWDFFVSYTAMDQPWAVWVAWVLEEAGFRVLVQAQWP